MKKIKKLSASSVLFVFLFLFLSGHLPAVDQKKTSSDTTGQKITQIKIGEDGITIKTQEGKEIKEKTGEIVLDKEGIKIKSSEPKDTSRTEIKIEIPKHSTTVVLNGGDIVKFGKDITVEQNEKVPGDVVAIGGDVHVKGTVEGSVVSIGGDIYVASTGIIEKDATSVGGDVEKEPGAIIRGQTEGLSVFPGRFFFFRPGSFWHGGIGFLLSLLIVVFFLFIGIVTLAIAPKNVQKVRNEVGQNVWKSALIGLLGEIMILPVFILLLITIIGIPVALLVLPLFILLALILGCTSVSLSIGERLKQNTSLKPQSPVLTLVMGILAVEAVSLFASFLRIFCGIFSPFCLVLAILGATITYVVCTVGFGGAILTLLGTRPKEKPVPVATPLAAEPLAPPV